MNGPSRFRLTLVAAVATMLAACAQDRVVLLANDDGTSSGAVAVLDPESGEARAVVSDANSETLIGSGPLATASLQPDEIAAVYGALLEGLPRPPADFTVYFEEGTTTITAESRSRLQDLLDEVAARPGAEVQVTGHTDRVGKVADNDALSVRRAEEVAAQLIDVGLDAGLVRIAGRGEREPVVETEDEVDEPRNRRVVVTVR